MWHLQTLRLKEWQQLPCVLSSEIWAWYCMDIYWWCHGALVIAGFLLLPNFLSSINSSVNESAQNWNLDRMRSLQAHSTHWRATCSYPTYGMDFTDYLRTKTSRISTSLISLETASARLGIHQHPGTRRYAFDGAFLAEVKFIRSVYWQYIHSLSV